MVEDGRKNNKGTNSPRFSKKKKLNEGRISNKKNVSEERRFILYNFYIKYANLDIACEKSDLHIDLGRKFIAGEEFKNFLSAIKKSRVDIVDPYWITNRLTEILYSATEIKDQVNVLRLMKDCLPEKEVQSAVQTVSVQQEIYDNL